MKKERTKFSIVIPTCTEKYLRKSLSSIISNIDLSDGEVIISANGCDISVKKYIKSLGKKFKLVWADKPIGFVRATNYGIKKSSGKFIILLNDDIFLNNQTKNKWLKMLLKPFDNKKVGISGPVSMRAVFWQNNGKSGKETILDRLFLPFWCVAIRRDVIKKIGLLDEIFSPGYGEDIDFCFKAQNAGYKIKKIKNLPIVHLGGLTFKNKANILEKWGNVIKERYATKVKTLTSDWTGWII